MSLLKDLLSIVRGEEPLDHIGEGFNRMLESAETMFVNVNVAFWSGEISSELRKQTFKEDVKLNKAERRIRREVLSHLVSNPDPSVVPYCFILTNVVKDAERIGDYVKNLVELSQFSTLDLPAGELRDELRRIGVEAEALMRRVAPVFQDSLKAEAEEMARKGRDLTQQLDAMFPQIAKAGYGSEETTSMVLLSRFYKRIVAHTVNILTSVIMPFHKINYFDESELES